MRHFVYLHGFASSPGSSKARFFHDRLAEHGLALSCPDLNEPTFETLTVSRMIDQLKGMVGALPPAPVVLIGSSLGGVVALHAAARHAVDPFEAHPIDRLILLAPALDFVESLGRMFGRAGLARWQESNSRDVHHHGDNTIRQIRFDLYQDALNYDSQRVSLSVPTLIFQGLRDEAVDPAVVEAFARSRPGALLHLLDDDHQLLSSLDNIWRESTVFLGLNA